jgi:outer membrane protein assembly factor BamB
LGDPDTGHEIWSSPAVYNGRVYVGVASHNAAPCVAGRVVALNALTGQIAWSFSTIDPSSCPFGTCLGAGVWSSPAIDTQFGTLFVGTGNPGQGCFPATANATRYPDGLLALDVSRGSLKGFYQVYPEDPGDLGDVGATPVLHRTEITNQCTGTSQVENWVSVPSKNGVVHTVQRSSAGIGTPRLGLPLNSGDIVASPAVLPFTESQSCGPTGSQTIQSGNDLFVPTFDGALIAVRQSPSGVTSVRWERLANACPCPLLSAPAVVTDLIFLGGGDGNVYATTTDGILVWEFGTEGLVASGPAVSHSTVYFGSYDGYLYAVSLDGQ